VFIAQSIRMQMATGHIRLTMQNNIAALKSLSRRIVIAMSEW
jgi:hypothetical protein